MAVETLLVSDFAVARLIWSFGSLFLPESKHIISSTAPQEATVFRKLL